MIKIIGVILLLVALAFVIQGFAEVASAPDLFERSEDSSAALDTEDSNE